MKEFFFENKGTNIYCYAWDEVDNPKGVVQLAHDMGDYCMRYDYLARFLNANGFIVVGQDLRGHGKSSGGFNHRGEIYGESFQDSVLDMLLLTEHSLAKYKLPILLFAIGYGATLAQAYLFKYSEFLSGAILCSPSYMRTMQSFLGGIIAGTLIGFVDNKSPAYVINNYLYKKHNSPFEGEKLRYAYLTRDVKSVKEYVKDPFCGAQFVYSLGFYKSYFNNSFWMYTKKKFSMIDENFPILILAGSDDSVTDNAKLSRKLFDKYVKYGKKNVLYNEYKNARHELIFECNRDEVLKDIFRFLLLLFK